MHGPFSWRKLIPTRFQGLDEPPGPTCVCEENPPGPLTGDCGSPSDPITFCIGYGSGPLGQVTQCYTQSGRVCGNLPPWEGPPVAGPPPITILPPIDPLTPLCPREKTLEFGLLCTRSFSPYDNPGVGCLNWTRNPTIGTVTSNALNANPYFNLPTGETSIRTQFLCLEYGNLNPSDFNRIEFIAGRNRDRYGGPLAAHYLKGYNLVCDDGDGYLFDDMVFGLTHIGHMQRSISRGSGAGQSRFGGTFPMEDAVLTLPLFGAMVNENPSPVDPQCEAEPCCDELLPPGESCYSCRESHNGGYGHYLPDNQGPTSGYFSFACFNPQSFLYSKTLPGNAAYPAAVNRGRIEIPTCSLWALIKGVRNYIIANENEKERYWELYGGTKCPAKDINAEDGESWWINTDPGGTNSAGTSNVRLVMDEMAERIRNVTGYDLDDPFTEGACDRVSNPYHFTPPNVFLWDKDAFLGATAAERWKHIYTIGYANILFDTGCTSIISEVGGITSTNAMIYLDNTAHADGVGLSHSARMLGWQGCNGNPIQQGIMTRLRSLQCDGQDFGNQPDTGFHCEDCLTQFAASEGKDCPGLGEVLWQGYTGGTAVNCGGDPTIYACTEGCCDYNTKYFTLIPDPIVAYFAPNLTNQLFINVEAGYQSLSLNSWYDICPTGSTQGPTASGPVRPFEYPVPTQNPIYDGSKYPQIKNSYGYRPASDNSPSLFANKIANDGLYRTTYLEGWNGGGAAGCFGGNCHSLSVVGRKYHAIINSENKPQVFGNSVTVGRTHGPSVVSGFTGGYYPAAGTSKIYKLFPPSVTADSISASPVHGIVLKANGGIETFGYSGWTASDVWPEEQTWLDIPSPLSKNPSLPSHKKAISIAAGGAMGLVFDGPFGRETTSFERTLYGYSAAVTEDGSLYTWGRNWSGCVNSTWPSEIIPVQPWAIAFGTPVSSLGVAPPNYIIRRPSDAELAEEGGCTAVFAGNGAMAVITNSPNQEGIPQYKVKMWGLNGFFDNFYYYGPADRRNKHVITGICNPPAKLKNVKKVVIGDCVAFALLHDGTIRGWGGECYAGGINAICPESPLYNIDDATDIQFGGDVSPSWHQSYRSLVVRRGNSNKPMEIYQTFPQLPVICVGPPYCRPGTWYFDVCNY